MHYPHFQKLHPGLHFRHPVLHFRHRETHFLCNSVLKGRNASREDYNVLHSILDFKILSIDIHGHHSMASDSNADYHITFAEFQDN